MAKKKTKTEALLELAKRAKAEMAQVAPMTQWERGFEAEARRLGQQEMDKRLAELPPEDGRPKACPRCGQPARVRRRAVPRTFQSMWGTHTFSRDYHYCEACKEGFFPRDVFIGLPSEGVFTEEVESRIADFAVNDTYAEAQTRWRCHYRHLPLSENQFRQVAKRLGAQVEACEEHLLEAGARDAGAKPSARLYVMADGGMVPMRGEWREVKVGVAFREENFSPASEGSRGAVTEARYTAVLGTQEDFKKHLRAGLAVEGVHLAQEVVWIADGAPSNWLLAGLLVPRATQVLDWCHAVENGMKCGRALLGDGDAGLFAWKRRLEALLWTGDVEALLQELRACAFGATAEQRRAIEDLVRYYRANAERMHYGELKRRGILIGSGIVESAHRHVIQCRMKKAGQHWGELGARRMARMRAVYRTAGPERFYPAIRWAHRASCRISKALPPRHKVDLRRRRMANR